MKSAIVRGLALILCLGLAPSAVAKHPISSIQGLQAQGVSIPIYQAGRSEPTAIVTIQRIHKDHQRHGFFRIGALPLWIAENVQIQLLNQQPEEQLLSALSRALRTRSGDLQRSVEIRRLQISFSNEGEPRLCAGHVSIAENGSWQLSDQVQLRTPSETLRCDRATISKSEAASGSASCWNVVVGETRTIPFLDLTLPLNSGSTQPTFILQK